MKNKDLIEEMLKELPSFVKTRFFALYLWQKVSGHADGHLPHILTPSELDSSVIGQKILHLRDISDLTDEEKKTWMDHIGNAFGPRFGSDYLRSIGILLPFLTIDTDGKPIKYSVNDIISLGWAKIKGNL